MTVKTITNSIVGTANKCAADTKILVLGVGNILLKDEGIGVHIAQKLQKHQLPDNVEVIDGGTASLDIFLSWQKPYKLIVIDAIKRGRKPGTIYNIRFKNGEIDKLIQSFNQNKDLKVSSHQFGLIDALATAQMCNCAPMEIVIIGVEPKEINYGLEPTEQVSRKVPEIINRILEEF
jgi:hydrogenase maturation protease